MPISVTITERHREYARFLLAFVFLGFLMKVAEELIHEAGHALFVLTFGGNILGMSISFTWPFAMSHTKWVLAGRTNVQMAMIACAGILFDTLTMAAGQAILIFRRRMRPIYAISLFWLSFWAYLSVVVYLVIGAVHPFGDILDLVNAVPVSRLAIGLFGVVLLVSNTYSLSIILRGVFTEVLRLTKASEAVSIFWAALHMFFVSVTVVKYGLPMPPTIAATVLVVIFIWSYLTARWLLVIVARLKGLRGETGLPTLIEPRKNESPDESVVQRRELRKGYAALLSIALISSLLTGYMINQYLATYSLITRTGIEVEATYFEFDPEGPSLNLSVRIYNPTHGDLTLNRIEFDVKLNRKFLEHQVLREVPRAAPDSYVYFDHVVALPLDRMFTLEDALETGRWDWTVTGSGYVDTLFGETLLRFESASTCGPHAG